MKIPEGKHLGNLCKRGHEWENSGKSLRSNKGCKRCCSCNSENNAKRYRKISKELLERKRTNRILFKDEIREKERQCYLKHREKRRKAAREYSQTPERKAVAKKCMSKWYKRNKG